MDGVVKELLLNIIIINHFIFMFFLSVKFSQFVFETVTQANIQKGLNTKLLSYYKNKKLYHTSKSVQCPKIHTLLNPMCTVQNSICTLDILTHPLVNKFKNNFYLLHLSVNVTNLIKNVTDLNN